MRIASLAAVAASLTVASVAQAELRADLIETKSIKLDGVPKEWTSLEKLTTNVKGNARKPDLEAKAAISYDANNLYVAADVTDDTLHPGADHVEVALGFPGGTLVDIELYPGDPGKSAGVAKIGGSVVSSAKVVEAPRSGGWSLEASIPWSAIGPAKSVRVGLKGAIYVHDADKDGSIRNIVGTAGAPSYSTLPPLLMESEQALADGLLKEKNIHSSPRYSFIANVAGDSMKERVLLYDRYLVVLGSNFKKGSEYYYQDLGDPDRIASLETRDLTGDGQEEIVLKRRFGQPTRYRESLVVLGFGSAETPSTLFQHEVSVVSDEKSVINAVSYVSDGGKTAIKITPGNAKGWDAGSYHEAVETAMDPVLLPWGTVASQTYKSSGGTFTKAAEEKQAGTPAPTVQASMDALPKAPPPPSAAELQDQVYALYKKERGVSGRPKFDLAVDVSGDRATERVLLHDRDLVVFGRGFKGGTGYTFTTLQQFSSPSDILDMSARDVTGDGKAEILVKGVVHTNAPKEAGGGTVDREVVIVYQLAGESLKRIFAAETARAMGKKRVAESITFSSGAIEVAPGKATEWTQRSYPFNQDTSPVGGFEPLVLPWSTQTVRYKWTGSSFSKQ